MKTSNEIDKLALALRLVQADIKHAVKDSTNPAFRSKYADLGAVWDAVRDALNKHGLSVIQMPEHAEDNRVHLTTRLMDSNGQWLEATASIPVTKQDAHGYGSGLTYLRRYSLASMLGVVSDDDDGNAAVEKPAKDGRNGAEVNKSELDRMSAPEQEIMRVWADTITDLHGAGLDQDAADKWGELDSHEKKMAVWALLDSKVRSSIKKLHKPTRAEIAAS